MRHTQCLSTICFHFENSTVVQQSFTVVKEKWFL